MKFDSPALSNPIDQLKVIGQPVDRIEGTLKTTGTARYAYENHDVVANQAYGFIVGAGIGKGRIESIDTRQALAAPGVLGVITAQNAGQTGKGAFYVAKALGGPDIDHYHQAVAIVVAETFEQARTAAQMLNIEYVRSNGRFDLDAARPDAKAPKAAPDTSVGDFEGAFRDASVTLDQTYTTPDQSHAMMEPHATIAAWNGDKLTLWCSVQLVSWAKRDIAQTLGIAKDNVHIMTPYIGGGFGGKGSVLADAVLASLAARQLGRPVKVALTRPMMFNNTTHRPATIQRIRIGAQRDGTISAIGHESWSGNLPGGTHEKAANQTQLLYAGANRMTRTRLAVLDLPEGNAMRAPGEASGMMALEIAMDEMAQKLNIDPVKFRIINDTQVNPGDSTRIFSTRQLIKCLETGARHFGWEQRSATPGARRDGRWLVGMGMAAAIRGNPVSKSGARVRLGGDGVVTVETDMTDIGTGSYTIIAQTAAEMLGLPMDKVVVRLGDSTFPESAGSGGQWGGNSSTSGVYAACVKLRETVAARFGFDPGHTQFVDGQVISAGKTHPLAHAAQDGEVVAEDSIEFGPFRQQQEQQTFGAHFVEVRVDAATGEMRITRMLAVCAAGRILNPKTARSQVIGAMTMGAGAALMEELIVDKRLGFFVNHDLAGYEVPVHADIPHQEVIFLPDDDPRSSPMKAKGVGELGISGVAAAIANAIYNATGARVREYPITLDKVLKSLPEMI
ncbi:aldehyde oxidoreductase molybdenum-binding subunit PaoC [Pseudomonas caspiana]|uniref:aldehyde oxidoreductase molybdenum-binding subunit PaoC n=1 Tax=Pseudomonas caspiana TaxID=1451454 RepID=UPI0032ECEA03